MIGNFRDSDWFPVPAKSWQVNMDNNQAQPAPLEKPSDEQEDGAAEGSVPRPREIGGRDGPEPTRFGDWEKAGRCVDF
jgi:hypothetical protein